MKITRIEIYRAWAGVDGVPVKAFSRLLPDYARMRRVPIALLRNYIGAISDANTKVCFCGARRDICYNPRPLYLTKNEIVAQWDFIGRTKREKGFVTRLKAAYDEAILIADLHITTSSIIAYYDDKGLIDFVAIPTRYASALEFALRGYTLPPSVQIGITPPPFDEKWIAFAKYAKNVLDVAEFAHYMLGDWPITEKTLKWSEL